MIGDRRVVAIVQARAGSTRLPGKVLEDLRGAPVLERVLRRVLRAQTVDATVLATTALPADDPVAEIGAALGVRVVRGDEDDVLSRFVLAARDEPADVYARITADCPFVDPGVIDGVARACVEPVAVDYCTNTLARTYPVGMDVEAFTSHALARANELATPAQREHVTQVMYQSGSQFTLRNVEAPQALAHPEYRVTLDTAEDLALLRALCAELGPDATLEAIVGLLGSRDDLVALNSQVAHREAERPSSW